MGWFFFQSARKHQDVSFSSPLGDGLVLESLDVEDEVKNFRPRLGLGWFLIPESAITCERHFRPRVGMGWFIGTKILLILRWVFVPAWGWVGSGQICAE